MPTGIGIRGICTCLPSEHNYNSNIEWLSEELRQKLVNTIGIDKRHVAPKDSSLHFYAYHASNNLIDALSVKKGEIGFILLITQTGDTRIPNTVIKLQTTLDLPTETLALEINMGCSGFVQGIYTAQRLLAMCPQKYGLVVCGDVSSKILAENDTGTIPLFSDGVSACLVEKLEQENTVYSLGNSANNGDAIALKRVDDRGEFLRLDGHKILMLGLQSVVPDVKKLLETQKEKHIEYYFFHQASNIINRTIIRKLGLDADKCPETLSLFGNTSSATIPLTMSTVSELREKPTTILTCGFGTGLSWATGILDLPPIDYLAIIER